MNHAVVNEDPTAKVIRDLREEIQALRALLSSTVDPIVQVNSAAGTYSCTGKLDFGDLYSCTGKLGCGDLLLYR